jgi:hypothetical protein
MRVDLNNFFKFYDDNLPKHRAAVDDFERLLIEKCPELLEDTSNWIKIYRKSDASEVFNIPWYPQTDNFSLPDRTCNSSACAMCLEYLKPGSLPAGPKGDNAYLKKVLSLGASEDHTIQTKVLESYGVVSKFYYNLGFGDLDRELEAKRPVVIGILHRGPINKPTGGHMICVIGKNASGDYWIMDPYGSILDNYTGPVENGRRVLYPRGILEKRWTIKSSKDGWGRIFQ